MLKLVCALLDYNEFNQIKLVCTLSWLLIISFWSNKIDVYNMRQIKKLTGLQACFLGVVRVIWCNSLGDSLFQVYVMNFVEIVLNYYSDITSHVSQAFTSCTHYTSYSLLNFVHAIMCDFWFCQPRLKNSLIFMQNVFEVWEFKENWLKILFLGKLGSKQLFLKSISSHTHAFYS